MVNQVWLTRCSYLSANNNKGMWCRVLVLFCVPGRAFQCVQFQHLFLPLFHPLSFFFHLSSSIYHLPLSYPFISFPHIFLTFPHIFLMFPHIFPTFLFPHVFPRFNLNHFHLQSMKNILHFFLQLLRFSYSCYVFPTVATVCRFFAYQIGIKGN